MAVTIKKAKAGVEDLHRDDAGTGATEAIPKSDGGTRTVRKINASHIPTTNTTRAKKSADNTTTTTIDVDASLQELYDDVNSIGVPDGTIIQNSSGTLQIAANSITNAKMAANSIDSDQYVDGSVDREHLVADIIDGTKLADNAVDSEHYVDGSIDNEHYADNSMGINELNMDNTGLTFSHFPIAGGKTAAASGGETSLTVSPSLQSGLTLASTDIVQATFEVNGAAAVHIRSAIYASGTTITITPSAALTAGDIISYVIYRGTTAVS